MKIYFDTEFIEDGRTIDLISIGMVREDGRAYYAESKECDLSKASPWVMDNVIPHLRPSSRKMRWVISADILDFVGKEPEFWGYYSDYDWIALCQLYGTMMALPKGWPMYCRDVKQEIDRLGISALKQEAGEHDALADARHVKALVEWAGWRAGAKLEICSSGS